jgi:hypothetical protein
VINSFRSVLAAEEAIINFLTILDPVFKWSTKSYNPIDFVKLHDGIVDLVELTDVDSHPNAEHAAALRAGQLIIRQLRSGLGPRHVFCRSLPPSSSKMRDDGKNDKIMLEQEVSHCPPSPDCLAEHQVTPVNPSTFLWTPDLQSHCMLLLFCRLWLPDCEQGTTHPASCSFAAIACTAMCLSATCQ